MTLEDNDGGDHGGNVSASGGRRPLRVWLLAVLALLLVMVVIALAVLQVKSTALMEEVKALVKQRYENDKTVWANETLAQKYEQPFVDLWDALRGTSDWVSVLSGIPFEQLAFGDEASKNEPLDGGVNLTHYDGDGRKLDSKGWKELLIEAREQGFRLVESEWHHSRFEPGDPPRSTVSMTLHAVQEQEAVRYIVRGDLEVEWSTSAKSDNPRPRLIEARNVRVYRRQGPTPFSEAFRHQISPQKPDAFLPILVYDLDSNALSDIVLPSRNELLLNQGGWKFKEERLAKHPPPSSTRAAVLADFTGDGRVDLLCAPAEAAALLYVADADGHFSTPSRELEAPSTVFTNPKVISAGDVDGDNDLDAWIAQYHNPYQGGQMPTPYYDANDALPACLLINDGKGHFTDGTVPAGLAAKRFRRTYSASLVDIDDDGDLDLVVASDFAGLDVYLNDGHGKFTDVSGSFVDKRHSFGMSLTFADYNLDEKLDFFMIGMASTTARRLARMGLGREDFPEHQAKRPEMGYGNRLYLAQGDVPVKRFLQAPFNDQVARTGWSWGCTSFDFDNDGDCDIYVANGHISGTSAKDYCTRFWCHDIYTGSSQRSEKVRGLFDIVHTMELNDNISWNGFEHNCLLMNGAGKGFSSIGFLMGVSLELDSRNVVSDDFDADGRRDLLVMGYRNGVGTSIRLLRNNWQSNNNWIGVLLRDVGPGRSPQGARVAVTAAGKRQIAAVLSGDSLASQHATTVHFGLGSRHKVDSIEVRWPDGSRSRIKEPPINRYHTIGPP